MLDIQYIRGDGNELLVDIGLSNAYDRRHRVAFESGYGLEGLPSLLKVSVGDQTFELGKIAETLIERRLERSGLLSYGIASVTNSSEPQQHPTIQHRPRTCRQRNGPGAKANRRRRPPLDSGAC